MIYDCYVTRAWAEETILKLNIIIFKKYISLCLIVLQLHLKL